MTPMHEAMAIGMRATRSMRLAIDFASTAVRQNRTRAALAIVGVAVGIAAVASLLTIGHSIQAHLRTALDALGADVVTITVADPAIVALEQALERRRPVNPSGLPMPGRGKTDPNEVLRVLSRMPEVESAASLATLSQCPNNVPDLEVHHADAVLPSLLSLQLASGRFLLPVGEEEGYVVLGSRAMQTVRRLYAAGGVGARFPVCGKMVTIVGVLRTHAGSELLQNVRIDNSVLLSDGALHRITRTRPSPAYLVRLRPDWPAQAAANGIAARLGALGLSGVQAAGAWQVLQSRREQIATYTQFLAILGGVSLLVGSLGISNVMLASVAERRAEIGLRMALGAARVDIVLQFLAESAIVCMLGAVLGLVMGIGGAVLALGAAGVDATVSVHMLAQPALAALACGLLAGAYPARRAAAVDPVVSLNGA